MFFTLWQWVAFAVPFCPVSVSATSSTVPTRIVSLNRIVHLNNLNRFVRAWTVLSGKITSYRADKIGVRQKVILLEHFDQKTIRFKPYCSYRKFWPKDNTVQPILSFNKIFTKRQYGSTHIVFQKNFHQKTIRFKPYCLLRKFWWIDNKVQSI